MEDKLNSKAYQTVSQRMQAEEATCQLTMTSEDGEDEWVTNKRMTRLSINIDSS